MKNLLFFLLLLAPVVAFTQPLGTWPVSYGDTPPTHTPSGSGTRIYLNISTNDLWNWNPAPVSAWVKYPKGFDQVSGCAAPAYTPTARQSVFAINSCTVLQNGRGPELYQYTGSAWVCLNCYPAYTAGTGIGISSGIITNTLPDVTVSLTGGGINTVTGTYPNFTITGNEVDGSTTNELQNLSLSGQALSISGGTGATLPVVGVTAGTGIGVSSSAGNFTVTNNAPDQMVSLTNGGGVAVTGTYPSFTLTATDLSATNELNTSFSVSGSNLALTDPGGTINVPVSSIAPVQAVAAGSGISISGTTTRTITAADVSPTNELQTLSLSGSDLTLSGGGGTVTLPGGGASDALGTGFTGGGGSGTIPDGTTVDAAGSFLLGDVNGINGGAGLAFYGNSFFMGDPFDLNSLLFSAQVGDKTISMNNSSVGNFVMTDNGTDLQARFDDARATPLGIEYGGNYSSALKTNDRSLPDVGTVKQLIAGEGWTWPLLAPDGSSAAPSFAFENSEKSGIYYEANVFHLAAANDEGGGPIGVAISAGNSETAQGGDLNISSGSSQNRAGGTVNILSGSSVDQDAGSIIMYAGSSENGQGGAYILSGGAGGARGGGFELSAGSSSGGDGGDVNLTAGYGATPSQNGRVTFFGNGVKIPSATTSEILSFSTVEAGQIIFCTDATANDGSTGVMQVYNGSTWKNCW